jgi:hypothetical protein
LKPTNPRLASQFYLSCEGIHPARATTFDQRGLPAAPRRRRHKLKRSAVLSDNMTAGAFPLAGPLLQMRAATTMLAPVIALPRGLSAIVRIRAPRVQIEILLPDAFRSSFSEENEPYSAKDGDCQNDTDVRINSMLGPGSACRASVGVSRYDPPFFQPPSSPSGCLCV